MQPEEHPLPKPPTRSGVGSYAVLAAGFLLLYALFDLTLKHPPGEFSYFPALEPLPFAPMRGFTFEQLALHVGRLAFLAPGLVFASLALARWVRPLAAQVGPSRRWLLLAGGVSLLISTFVLTSVLRGRAIVDDELTYRDQAMLLFDGKVAEATDPPLGFEPFTIQTRVGRTGKYLFGEPLVQIPGSLVGLPGLLHVLLAGLTLGAWLRVARAAGGPNVGAWSTVALAFSPMFILTNGTGLSHATALACVVLIGLGLTWCAEGRPMRGALLAGIALGFLVAVRPQVAVPVGGVLAAVLVRRLWKAGRRREILVFLAAVGFWVTLVGLYDAALTGAFWRLPWDLYPLREKLGFGPPHSLRAAAENLLVSAVRWNGWWLGFPLGLGLLAVWEALGRPSQGLRLWWACGLALIGFNFLYYSPGVSETGPVYYYELLLPASLLAGHTIVGALARWPRVATSALLVHLLFGTGSFLVEQVQRLDRLHRAIHGRVDAVLSGLELPAVLFHEVPSTAGWVYSFPVRYRNARDPVVTYPRSSPEETRILRARWAERHCYYFRLDPHSGRPEVYRCESAEELLARPPEPVGSSVVLRALPTAARLGYLAPPPPAPSP